jgi:hypothetical protein
LACLQSVETFLAAGPIDLAAVVLVHGLHQQAVAPDAYGTVRVSEIVAAVLRAFGFADVKVGSKQWDQLMATPPYHEVPSAVREGVLTAERYLCVWRETDSAGTSLVRLLRRGRHALLSGDPYLYLRG